MSKKAKPSHLQKLLKTWAGASPEERQAFLDLVAVEERAKGQPSRPADPPPLASPSLVEPAEEALIANGRYLLPSTIARVEAVMRARNLAPSAIMAELGFSPRDASLTRALAMKASLRLAVIAELARWLRINETAGAQQG